MSATATNFNQAEIDEIERGTAHLVSLGLDPDYAKRMATETVASRKPKGRCASVDALMSSSAEADEHRTVNKTAEPLDQGSAVCSFETNEVECQSKITTTNAPISQGAITKWGVEITDDCPAYYINKKLANCRALTSTERCCVGLLNFLMKQKGYAFASNAQLGHWLGLKSPDSAKNMLCKLRKKGFVKDDGTDRQGRRKLVVYERWRNHDNKPTSEQIPF